MGLFYFGSDGFFHFKASIFLTKELSMSQEQQQSSSVGTNSKIRPNIEYRIYSDFENASNTEYRIYSVPEK